MPTDAEEYRGPNYTLDDVGMYGIERVLIKKHVWPEGYNADVYGALFHDAEAGDQFFVTQEDLCRYEIKPTQTD